MLPKVAAISRRLREAARSGPGAETLGAVAGVTPWWKRKTGAGKRPDRLDCVTAQMGNVRLQSIMIISVISRYCRDAGKRAGSAFAKILRSKGSHHFLRHEDGRSTLARPSAPVCLTEFSGAAQLTAGQLGKLL